MGSSTNGRGAEGPGGGFRAFERDARQRGFQLVAGIDEAGRGPLAGPVVAAAVILPQECPVTGIRDSKKLTPGRRDDLFRQIQETAFGIGIGVVDAPEIDRINILQAALQAMAAAVSGLRPAPDYLLIDGIHPLSLPLPLPQLPVAKGDNCCISIAAASIVAKVTRDRLMQRYHQDYPLFGFDRHKGYPTRAHRDAIRRYGCCPIHRRSFKGVREFLQ